MSCLLVCCDNQNPQEKFLTYQKVSAQSRRHVWAFLKAEQETVLLKKCSHPTEQRRDFKFLHHPQSYVPTPPQVLIITKKHRFSTMWSCPAAPGDPLDPHVSGEPLQGCRRLSRMGAVAENMWLRWRHGVGNVVFKSRLAHPLGTGSSTL